MQPPATRNVEQFLATRRKWFRQAADAEQEIRRDALEDLRFYVGEQWPDEVKSDRNLTNRPCLNINRLPQFGAQIINEQRQSRPSIQINPVGDGADVETAEIIQGLTRHVEIASHAEIAYDVAFERAVIHGFGYFRLLTGYCDDASFDQEIMFEPIEDPFSVYLDPSRKKPDGSDMEYGFICQDLSREQYEDTYPDSELASLADFRSVGDGDQGWYGPSFIRVAEHYWVESKKKTLVRLLNGRTVPEEELPEDAAVEVRGGRPMIRRATVREVFWCKMNAREILEARRVPGKRIPIVPVEGSKLIVNGRKKLIGIVRYAKDAQRMYNYTRSGIIEQLALSSKAPWIMAAGQDENFEREWQTANVKSWAVLHYTPKMIGDQVVGPPMRNVFEPPIHALSASLAQTEKDLMSTTGMFEPSIGQNKSDQSGIAIERLQRQGERANAHLLDNMKRAVMSAGEIILGMIPEVYDVERVVRIVNPDGTHRMVTVNGPGDGAEALAKVFDLTVGRYDVTVSVGATHDSRRKEFVASVLALVQAAPQVMSAVLDLVVRNMDWPGSQEIADRLKKMLPPQLQDAEEGEKAQIPPQAQAQLAALMQQNAELTKALEASSSAIETKRLELESKERMNALSNQVNLIVAELKAKTSHAETLAQLEYGSIETRLDLLHKQMTLEQDAAQSQQAQQAQQQAQQGDQPQPETAGA